MGAEIIVQKQLLQLYFDEAILQIGDEAALGQIQITKIKKVGSHPE